MHCETQLFVSVYVDDYKMAGTKENIKPMWQALRKKSDLDPEVSLHGSVHLGCQQNDVEAPQSLKAEKSELMKAPFDRQHCSIDKSAGSDPLPGTSQSSERGESSCSKALAFDARPC